MGTEESVRIPLPSDFHKPTSRRAQLVIAALAILTIAVVGIVWSWQTNQSRYMTRVTVSVGQDQEVTVPGYSPPYNFSYSLSSPEYSQPQLTVSWNGRSMQLVDLRPLTGYADVVGLHFTVLEVNYNYVVLLVIGR
jgi:hypothetical protein